MVQVSDRGIARTGRGRSGEEGDDGMIEYSLRYGFE